MKWEANITHPKKMRFLIETEDDADSTDGTRFTEYKLFVYEDERNTYDYVKGSLEVAQQHALRRFNVPFDAWQRIE